MWKEAWQEAGSLALNRGAGQVGLPMFSFMIIGSVGLQQGIAAKYREMDRLKTYIPPEDPEKILQVHSRSSSPALL